MRSVLTLTVVHHGEEQIKQLPLTDLCWLEYVASENEIHALEQQEELQRVKFRDESAIYSWNGNLPLRYIRYDDPMEKALTKYEKGLPITELVLDPRIHSSESTPYSSFLHLTQFLQFAGTFTSLNGSDPLYCERWTMGSYSEERLDSLLEDYRSELEEEGCIGCGVSGSSSVGGYCAGCWIETHL